mgnify:CR=1 FL=1
MFSHIVYLDIQANKHEEFKMRKELKTKILFTIVILTIIQFISNIPTYGINREVISSFINSETGNMLSFFTMFSGNAFYQMSMFQ